MQVIHSSRHRYGQNHALVLNLRSMDYWTLKALEELLTRARDTDLAVRKILQSLEEAKQQEIENMAKHMASAQDILAAVEAETSEVQSIIVLLDQIKAALDVAGTDEAMLEQVKTMIDGNKQAMADAVARNTPTAPAVSP